MTIPTVDTFEKDITEEIKQKEASLGDIASATGTIGNDAPSHIETHTGTSIARLVAIIIFLTALGGGAYYYYTSKMQPGAPTTPALSATSTEQLQKETIAKELNGLSPLLSQGIASRVSHVNTTPFGTALNLTDYASVFRYMIDNEEDIARDMLAGKYDLGDATTTPSFTFTDVTESNQNMRTVTVGGVTLVYAFVNEHYLVFASGTKEVLSVRSVILK